MNNQFGKYLKTYTILGDNANDPLVFLESHKQEIVDRLTEGLQEFRNFKFSLALKITFSKDRIDGAVEYSSGVFRSRQVVLHQSEEVVLDESFNKIIETMEKWTQKGSNWVFDKVDILWIDLARYTPLRGDSYIPLPKKLQNKKACVNVRNKRNDCGVWAVVSVLYPAEKHSNRMSSYPRPEDVLNLEGINYPLGFADFEILEKQNNLSINIYGWENDEVIVHKISEQPGKKVCILLYESHYVGVKNLNRLLCDNPLPAKLKYKMACINIKQTGDDSGLWAVVSVLYPAKVNSHMKSNYPKPEEVLNLKGIKTPLTIKDFDKLEKQNDLGINIFGWEYGGQADGQVIIHRISKQPENLKRVNILLCSDHYVGIKNLNRLLADQNKHGGQTHFCERCLHGYSKKELLESHTEYCKGVGGSAVKIEMPTENKLKFVNYHKQLSLPYIIYADYEALTTKIEGPELNPEKSNTQNTECHEACSYCYVVVRYDGVIINLKEYRGVNPPTRLLEDLQQEEKNIKEMLEVVEKMIMTEEDVKNFENATTCHICEELLNGDSVRDHCHITGKFRGAAHNECNLKLRINPKTMVVPVVFHNLRGYDSHLTMHGVSKVGGKITCIPNNTEKYISFTIGQLRFIDSQQFLLYSLDKLVSANPPESFVITKKFFPDKIDLLMRKGVYPYDYMNSWPRFNERQLPPKELFYSKLNDTHISLEDYAHAQKVWTEFGCKTMGDYHDLYNRSDVLLLADVFENFRKTCLKQYKLDPAHYYTSPGLSWDALLKHSGVELELLTDYDQHLFIEKGMRGGISMVSKRHCKANNKYVKDYNPEKPSKYIMYLDANNLYGWAMSQPLPVRDFTWEENLEEEKILTHPVDDEYGYILEVDLEYPEDLHDKHNAYPLAPESLVVKTEWMSDYQKNFCRGREVEKLVPNLQHKEKYVLHYRNLQLYCKLGMHLKKIHRALKFVQEPWMKSYIELNTEERKKAKSDFEKDLYKLMNNSVFGKTMENLRKRVDVKIVRSNEHERIRKLLASPLFARSNIFDYDLAGIQMHKSKLKLDKPVYVGMSILDLSKNLMYDFYYNILKEKYGDQCELLYTDTDSLLLEIHTDDVYKDMKEQSHLYDTSDYPQNHFLHSIQNKKVLGKMKDECAGRLIDEYVGLRPKMYSILEDSGSNIKKAKGIKRNVVKKNLQHQNYKECLFNGKTFRHGMNILRSIGHNIYGQHLNKTSLSPFDSKRYILADGIHTNGYGYKS